MLACGEQIRRAYRDANSMKQESRGFSHERFKKEIYKIQENNKDSNNDKPAISIKDFDSVGWYYDFYNNDSKILFCKECRKIFKKKSNRQEYCSDDCSSNVLKRQKYKWDKENRNKSEN